MALVTVRRAGGSAGGPAEEDAPRRGQLQRRQSFVVVKGAARLLPAEEPPPAEPPPAEPPCQAPGQQERHLHLMMQLLRPQDAIRLAVRLESARPRRVRYLLLVRPEEAGAEAETALLGVDFAHEGATRCTLGMVLPLWSDTQVFLDGDGGFSVTSGGETRIFKPISVQTMWAALQELHRACEDAARGGHIPGGPALAWARGYAAALGSEQSCLNEWLAMADLESVRPASPTPLRQAVPELSEQAVRALLREVMAAADLENVTSKEVREELERRTGHSLAQHKDFIDNEMLLVLAQMDRPSRVFPHLFLGSEWNAANLEELQQNRVTHILNVAREIDNFFPALFTYMNVRVYDEEAAELLPHWNDTFLFLSRVRSVTPRGVTPQGHRGHRGRRWGGGEGDMGRGLDGCGAGAWDPGEQWGGWGHGELWGHWDGWGHRELWGHWDGWRMLGTLGTLGWLEDAGDPGTPRGQWEPSRHGVPECPVPWWQQRVPQGGGRPGAGALPHGAEPLGRHGAGLRHEGVRVAPGAGAAARPALPARRPAQPRLHAPARLLPGHPERQPAQQPVGAPGGRGAAPQRGHREGHECPVPAVLPAGVPAALRGGGSWSGAAGGLPAPPHLPVLCHAEHQPAGTPRAPGAAGGAPGRGGV